MNRLQCFIEYRFERNDYDVYFYRVNDDGTRTFYACDFSLRDPAICHPGAVGPRACILTADVGDALMAFLSSRDRLIHQATENHKRELK